MKELLRQRIIEALLEQTELESEAIPEFKIEVPAQSSHGDYAANVAMLLAKPLRRAPRKIAEDLIAPLSELAFVDRVEVAGPGFLNIFAQKSAWQEVARDVLRAGENYGRGDRNPARRVMVEFVSANPTGPLHFGHGRGAVVGDVLAALLEFSGHQVSREFYLNDAGRQVRNLALSVDHHRKIARGEDSSFPEDGYHGDYVKDLAGEVPEEIGDDIEALEHWAVERMLLDIQQDLDDFGIHMDRYVSERAIVASGRIEECFSEMESLGVLEQRDGARWFASDRFGDEKARVLVKSDGSNTYFATDIAYHLDKLRRGFDKLVNIWGADHHGYVPRMQASLRALGQSEDALEVVLVQMVSLVRDGKPVVLSKRAGEIITLREVFEEVGRDAARFFFLVRSSDSQMEFDLELAKRRTLENPVFYVQYGHARLSSILAKAGERGIPIPNIEQALNTDLSPLDRPEEMGLLKRMAGFGEMVSKAADAQAPHQVVYYLQDLVAAFHSYYTSTGKSDPILGSDPAKVQARLVMVLALRQVLKNALTLVGVGAPERMESLDGGGEG
ncbi:MAG: arginine--tRNA ligase [Deltaproteobacteria bacterium]|nr:arginine--tRNA ligase [Deltaproteobacteria bacterium]